MDSGYLLEGSLWEHSLLCGLSTHLQFGALDWRVINTLNGSFRRKCALLNHKHLAWMDTHVARVVWLNLVFKLDSNKTQHHVGDTLLSQRQRSLDKELGSVGSKRASTVPASPAEGTRFS